MPGAEATAGNRTKLSAPTEVPFNGENRKRNNTIKYITTNYD